MNEREVEHDDGQWEQAAEADRWRELDIIEALNECKTKGVSVDALQTLARETGARWKPEQTA